MVYYYTGIIRKMYFFKQKRDIFRRGGWGSKVVSVRGVCVTVIPLQNECSYEPKQHLHTGALIPELINSHTRWEL